MTDKRAAGLTEADLVAACERMRQQADLHPRRPAPLLLSSYQYAEFKRRGWIVDGCIDWAAMARDF